jgi:phage terminase large subunit
MAIHIDLSQIKEAIVPAFLPFFNVRKRYCSLRGGRYSGKSHAAAQKIILRCMLAEENGVKHKFLCLRKTSPSVRQSVFELIKMYIEQWGLLNEVKIHNTRMNFEWKNGCEIHCMGLDNPDKIKSMDITGAWLEESIEMTLDDIRSVNMICRLPTDYIQILLTFNPVSKQSWIYEELYTDKDNEFKGTTFFHHSTYLDNPYVPEQTRKTIDAIAASSEYHRLVWQEGLWASREGLVFENWSEVSAFPVGMHIYGCDFGWQSPTAVVKVRKEKDDLYVKELLYRQHMTNPDLIKWIKSNLSKTSIIVGDAAQPERIKEAQNAGVKMVPSRREKGSIIAGVEYLQRHNIKIVKPSVNLKNEIGGYMWKKQRDGRILKDEIVQVDDHALDSLRLAVWTKWGYQDAALNIYWV